MRYNVLSSQSGLSIIATVMVMMILALFAAVGVSLVTTGAGIGMQEEQGAEAFYIAEAGLQKTLNYIIKQKGASCATSETCACTDAAAYANTNPSIGAGSFNVSTTPTQITNPTTLSVAIIAESYTPSIIVSSTTGYAAGPGRIMIDREVIEYTSLTATTFEGCRRGAAGTTATAHASGTRVGQKQCLITSTGTISGTFPLSSIQRRVSTIAELQNGWSVGGAAFPTDNLNSVHCISSTACWAVGDNGTIAQWNGTSWSDVTAALSPTTENLNSVYMISATEGWAVGDPGGVAAQRPLILKWNGSIWTAYDSSALDIDIILRGVFCSASDNCWAVGDEDGNELILKWNSGTSTWSRVGPYASIPNVNLNSVHCTSTTDCWAVGDPGGASQRPLLIRWNGATSTWSIYDSSALNINQTLNSVYCIASNNCWAVGDPDNAANERPLILFWDGTSWTRRNSSLGINQTLNSVHCTSTTDCWAVGNQSGGELIIKWNSGTSTWSRVGPYPDIPDENLNSVYMVSPTDGWAVGANGTIARWNGTNWYLWQQANATALRWNHASWSDKSALLPLTTNQLRSVSMLSYADGWAVGNPGAVASLRPSFVRWSGSAWTAYDSTTLNINRTLRGVYCSAGNDCWAVGNPGGTATEQPLILWWDGTTWTKRNSSLGINQRLNSVYCVSSNNCWAVGNPGGAATERPLILWWDGTTWQRRNSSLNINQTLNSVHCVSSTDCWAVGNQSGGELIIKWSGISWSRSGPYVGIPDVNLNSVFMLDTNSDGIADDGWAVGNRTGAVTNGWIFLRWNNPTPNTWNRITVDTSPTIAQNLNSVFMTSSRDGWAVGNNGIIFQWNGSNWSKVTSVTGADLNGLYIIGTSGPKGQWREVFQ